MDINKHGILNSLVNIHTLQIYIYKNMSVNFKLERINVFTRVNLKLEELINEGSLICFVKTQNKPCLFKKERFYFSS